MPYVSNSPEWWPVIQQTIVISSVDMAWFAAAIYDYREASHQIGDIIMQVELIWTRYAGIAWSLHVQLLTQRFRSLTLTPVILILRASALYANSKRVLVFLLFWFIVEQAVLLTTIILQFNTSSLFGERFVLSGISVCQYTVANISWATPANNSVMLAFESLLVVFVAYQLVNHVRDSHQRWRVSWGIKSIFAEIVVGNLFYYLVLLLAFTLNAATPSILLHAHLSSVAGQAYIVIHTIISNYVYTMAGPHLILSLRRSHARRINGVTSGNVESVSEVQFEDTSPVVTIF
ncbi:hypothetical protein CONPUDRAFT_68750 [Coniophora puteana RWD-64-598 SS2]|uniref:Uncharacterized protein n=1 Tax=Coniophora puteana (strain RWD-64-598) TaxID=741705 RepID=A0A5M3N5G0_CONPW|nr:uncharacterized protein CONPUDRAFT_68750 [Coniophora puteana RWD-64-598 SS2]EIW86151.1 hypothetical protein CONPUDRAFT_68750 [Coniophora puteana RWD-64-598 SS2]